jgi:hypothetical protein|tara:strand:+ start:784 stop:1302 length:519 start_codon:yes stop_codon:yes gene_type:complete
MNRLSLKVGLSVIILMATVSFASFPKEKKRVVVEPIKLEPMGIDVVIPEVIPETPRIEPLIDALIMVESLGNDSAIGDVHMGEPSVGVLQIRPIMVREVNRILKLKRSGYKFKRKDRFSREKSIEMFMIWYEFHHKDSDYEKISRSWNGGPKGHRNNRTLHYWKKVQQELNQ